jgi:hypothetical protein
MRVKRILISMVAMIAAVALTSDVFATALTASRNTLSRSGAKIQLTMASNVVVYAGSLVCVDSSGLANPAADTSGFSVIGMAEQTVDNRTAVYVATKKITVVRGVFRWANADVIVAADIGKIVYVTDDATVNKTGGGQNIIAGSVVDVDDDGVWVDTAKIGPIGAATPSSLAVSGAATVGTTLGVSGLATLSANAKISSATANVLMTNTADNGTCAVYSKADRVDDAGDYNALLFGADGSLAYQTDQASAGTLATKLSVGNTGIITMKGSATLDNTASATELNITETNVKVTGNLEVTGTATLPTITGLGKVFTLTPITNIVYNGGATTGNLYIVTYTP